MTRCFWGPSDARCYLQSWLSCAGELFTREACCVGIRAFLFFLIFPVSCFYFFCSSSSFFFFVSCFSFSFSSILLFFLRFLLLFILLLSLVFLRFLPLFSFSYFSYWRSHYFFASFLSLLHLCFFLSSLLSLPHLPVFLLCTFFSLGVHAYVSECIQLFTLIIPPSSFPSLSPSPPPPPPLLKSRPRWPRRQGHRCRLTGITTMTTFSQPQGPQPCLGMASVHQNHWPFSYLTYSHEKSVQHAYTYT